MWYPPRANDDDDDDDDENADFEKNRPSHSGSNLAVVDETATSPVDGGSLWKNWHVNDRENSNDIKNNPFSKNDDRLNYLVSNNWHLIPKNIASSSRRQYIHGVEVRKLGKDHFLCGEHGLFATRKFSRFDIIGEYTGMVVGSTVNGHYVAALEDTTHEASLGVDAQKCGNEMRFINSHLNISFSANVTMRTAYVNSYPHILLVCTQDIEPEDELLLDYGEAYNNAYLIPKKENVVVTSTISSEDLMRALPMPYEDDVGEDIVSDNFDSKIIT